MRCGQMRNVECQRVVAMQRPMWRWHTDTHIYMQRRQSVLPAGSVVPRTRLATMQHAAMPGTCCSHFPRLHGMRIGTGGGHDTVRTAMADAAWSQCGATHTMLVQSQHQVGHQLHTERHMSVSAWLGCRRRATWCRWCPMFSTKRTIYWNWIPSGTDDAVKRLVGSVSTLRTFIRLSRSSSDTHVVVVHTKCGIVVDNVRHNALLIDVFDRKARLVGNLLGNLLADWSLLHVQHAATVHVIQQTLFSMRQLGIRGRWQNDRQTRHDAEICIA